jgi:hypothetical protein
MPENHRAPLKRCLVCGLAMLASKSDEKLPQFDTFTCLRCGSVTTYAPRRVEPKSDIGPSSSTRPRGERLMGRR